MTDVLDLSGYNDSTRAQTLVTDSQYSSRRFRGKVDDCGVVAVRARNTFYRIFIGYFPYFLQVS